MRPTVLIAGVMFVMAAVIVGSAQVPKQKVDPRIQAYDEGPNEIDVSEYPEEMQAAYKVYEVKCGKCHKLARAINCDFALEDEWERYVKRMMRRSGDFITPDDGKIIYEFVVYDSQHRRKELYDRKLAESKQEEF